MVLGVILQCQKTMLWVEVMSLSVYSTKTVGQIFFKILHRRLSLKVVWKF
jgi:hypothetical protein